MSIQIYYGPYEAHGIIKHRPQKLHSLLGHLTKLKYDIDLIPTNFLNVVTVQMRDKEIFRCDIRNLLFNIDYEDDVVAKIFITAVEEANSRLNSDDNVSTLPAKLPHF